MPVPRRRLIRPTLVPEPESPQRKRKVEKLRQQLCPFGKGARFDLLMPGWAGREEGVRDARRTGWVVARLQRSSRRSRTTVARRNSPRASSMFFSSVSTMASL